MCDVKVVFIEFLRQVFVQIGECICEISRKPVSGPPRGLWRLQIMPQHPQMRSYKILSGFNRFPMAKNLGNKKKFAQIGQCIREISRKPVLGPPRGFWRLQIMPQHPQMRSYKILGGFNRFPMAKNLGNKKKFAQIGQYIHKRLQKPFTGPIGTPRGVYRSLPKLSRGVSPLNFEFLTPTTILCNKISVPTTWSQDSQL